MVRADAAAQHDHLWVVQQRYGGDGVGKEAGGLRENFARECVTFLCEIEDLLCAQIHQTLVYGSSLAAESLLPNGLNTGTANGALQLAGLLEVNGLAGHAGDRKVANLAGGPLCPMVHRAPQEYPRADPGSHRDEDEIIHTLCNALGTFPESGEIDVVLDRDGKTKLALRQCLQWDLCPTVQVGRGQNDAAIDVGDTRSTDGEVQDRCGDGGLTGHLTKAITDQADDGARGLLALAQASGPVRNGTPVKISQHHAEARAADIRGGNQAMRGEEAKQAGWTSARGLAIAELLYQTQAIQMCDGDGHGCSGKAGSANEIGLGAGAVRTQKAQQHAAVCFAQLRWPCSLGSSLWNTAWHAGLRGGLSFGTPTMGAKHRSRHGVRRVYTHSEESR